MRTLLAIAACVCAVAGDTVLSGDKNMMFPTALYVSDDTYVVGWSSEDVISPTVNKATYIKSYKADFTEVGTASLLGEVPVVAPAGVGYAVFVQKVVSGGQFPSLSFYNTDATKRDNGLFNNKLVLSDSVTTTGTVVSTVLLQDLSFATLANNQNNLHLTFFSQLAKVKTQVTQLGRQRCGCFCVWAAIAGAVGDCLPPGDGGSSDLQLPQRRRVVRWHLSDHLTPGIRTGSGDCCPEHPLLPGGVSWCAWECC
eukprot:TRINITY_DN5931_c0_g1_i3.p3 TRINITY_DN5931_c0_g1~~TRINITY_DN5931_c0_g1_i3.p3  ORF type:complete len:254 (+),score=33.57 TRINITY_DN5931_c0_g1_i3:36-797(+)